MRRKDPKYHLWYAEYAGETPVERKFKPKPDQLERLRLRRRIEDVREGLRIDRDVFKEVWDNE